MAVQHADLAGADLHEPKGADSAAANTVYVFDGAGSGSAIKLTASSLDTTNIKNTNKFFLTASLTDVSTSSTIYVPVPVDCTLNKVITTISAAVTTANGTVTVANYAGTTIGTITITQSGSAPGDIDTLVAASNNTFLADTYVKISSNGACDTTSELKICLEFTYA